MRFDGLDQFAETLRIEHCVRGPDGSWRCKCGEQLPDELAVHCASCLHDSAIRRAETQRQQERDAWVSKIRDSGARAYLDVPAWDHLDSANGFAERVADHRLIAAAERYQPHHGSLLIIGPSGAGKTSALARGLRRLRAERISKVIEDPSSDRAREALRVVSGFVWTSASELARSSNAYRFGQTAEPELFSRAARASLLVIDELGPEPSHRTGEIFDLVDRRYATKRQTFATSGLSQAGFIERYGDALFRRLTEVGVGRLLDLHSAT